MFKGSAKLKAGFGVYLLMDTDRYFHRLKLFLTKVLLNIRELCDEEFAERMGRLS